MPARAPLVRSPAVPAAVHHRLSSPSPQSNSVLQQLAATAQRLAMPAMEPFGIADALLCVLPLRNDDSELGPERWRPSELTYRKAKANQLQLQGASNAAVVA